MYSSKVLPVCILLFVLGSFSVYGADDAASVQIAQKPADVQYPFIAKATGNDIYIRSGKGTAYYYCGKVNRGEEVTVYEETFGWAKVLPPKGCYSWIHKDYVKAEANKPNIGVLQADSVRVWAGSDYIEAMRSSSLQTKLNEGEIVELLPDQPEESTYYKIKPPAGAYLWINAAYLEYVGPVQTAKPAVVEAVQEPKQEPKIETKPSDKMPVSTETSKPVFSNLTDDEPKTDTPEKTAQKEEVEADIPAQPAADATENLKACYEISAKIDQELQKPIKSQNYATLKKSLEAIKADTSDSKASTYAQILLERIQRYELAISVVDTLKKQDEALAKAKEQIAKSRDAKIKGLPVEVEYLYAGTLKVSHVYTQKTGQKRYLVQGKDGKIQCYAIPATEQISTELESLIGENVGIRGKAISDKKALVTLVSVAEVDALE